MMSSDGFDFCGLFVLSASSLADCLFSFFSVKELVGLDTAMTNHAFRPSLLAVFSLMRTRHLNFMVGKSLLQWMIDRNIHMERITLTSELSSSDVTLVLSMIEEEGEIAASVKLMSFSRCARATMDSHLEQLFCTCRNLEHLNLSHCTFLSNTIMLQFSSLCPTLISLDLSNCDLGKVGKVMSKGLPKLTSLSLSRSDGHTGGSSMVKDSTVKALGQGCPALVALDLSHCDNTRDGAILVVANTFPSLTALHLAGCDKITDSSVRTISQNCPNLTSIELGVDHTCSGKITDSSIISLSHNCPGLVALGVSRCYNITDAAAIVLSKGCPSLHHLDFSCCSRITNEGIIALSEGCHALTTLHLAKCSKITGVAVTALSQGCPLLSTLSLHSCSKVTDISLIALAQKCAAMKILDLSYCNGLTEVAITALAENCRALSQLCLLGCDGVNDQAVLSLHLDYPNIRLDFADGVCNEPLLLPNWAFE